MKKTFTFLLVIGILFFSSCESDAEKKERLAYEEQQQIELEERRIEEEKEKELFEKYKNNFLVTGSTPYSYCFGENSSCSSYGCSELSVKTPGNSDVVVTLKKGNEVVRHVYIRAGNTYTFQIPNGTYQPFFYYGNGWNPEKVMKVTDCGTLKGGFVSAEHFGKDSPQLLNNSILQYELILQQSGNFSTKPSNPEEAF